MEELKLKDKVIVVSGGTKGVGRAASEEFARQGAKVVIGGRDEASALKSIRLMKTYGSEGMFVHTDLRNVDDCKKLFDEGYKEFGKIDGFFNYAGITPVSPLDTCDEKTFNDVMDINFRACFFCCQHAVGYMRKNGGGFSVNDLLPHYVSLRISQGESEAELRKRAGQILPMGRMLERSDYLSGLVYLMSDDSAMMTGSTFRITAGEYI